MNLTLLYSLVRMEEKMLLESARQRNISVESVKDESVTYPNQLQADVVLNRCLSFYRGLYAARFLEAAGIRVVNSSFVAQTCGDKALTNMALDKAGVPTPKTRVVFSEQSAQAAAEELGYPLVLKPVTGSWARFVCKALDADSLEGFLEHKKALGPTHAVYYLQEFVEKPGRDIRAFVVGDQTIAAIYRESPHWITNTARGGQASNCPVSDELNDVCLRAAKAVGGGVISVDVMEQDNQLLVHEVNHTTEFKNSVQPTGVDIPGAIIDYCVEKTRR